MRPSYIHYTAVSDYFILKVPDPQKVYPYKVKAGMNYSHQIHFCTGYSHPLTIRKKNKFLLAFPSFYSSLKMRTHIFSY